jgi:hypothetical protein
VQWSEIPSQFNFRIIYRPGAQAIQPNALSRKPGNDPDKADQSNDQLKNCYYTLLSTELFDPEALQDMMNNTNLRAVSIEVITPAHIEYIDSILTRAYAHNNTAIQLMAAIQDPTVTKWSKALQKQVCVAMTDCTVYNGKLYYKDRVYALPDDELYIQLIYRAYNIGLAGHPGQVKVLD